MKTEFKKIKSFTTEEKFLAELCQKHNLQPDQFTADHTTRTFVFSTTALDDSNSNQLTPIIDENFENGKTIYSILKSDQPNETLACYQIINEKQTFEGNLQANHDDENWIFQKIR